MKIALDYDNTITADPGLWSAFAELALSKGHSVTIVTSRDEVFAPLPEMGIPIVYCAYKAKARCFQADIWIDDDPRRIFTDLVV